MQLAARQLTAHFTFRTSRPARRTVPSMTATQLAKRAGESQDRALYTCHCGFAWTAEVSTSVGCPHCGTDQAW